MKIAWVNTGRYTSSLGAVSFSDPVHLVAMHNLCKQAGHHSRVFQLGAPSPEASLEAIAQLQPEVLCLSFLAPFKNDIDVVDALLALLRGKGVRLFLGGPDIEFDPGFYRHKFQTSREREGWSSRVLVDGPGERLVEAIAPWDFDPTHPEALAALEAQGAALQTHDDGLVEIGGLAPTSLDLHDYTRDYDLQTFGYKAGVKWATGCWAACSFCPNVPGKSAYKASEKVAEEVEYLLALGAQKLDIASPQFTAHPALSSKLIAALPASTPPVFFSSRVDSLYHAITRFPEPWKRFANSNSHGIGLGVDSFLPDKLMRLRKYAAKAQAEAQQERLDAVLSFFNDTRLNVVFYMITFEWEMQLGDVQQELSALLRCLNLYASIIQIAPENVTNALAANKGSYFSTQRSPMDFLRFERDPRIFLMLYTLYSWHELLEEEILRSSESHELMEAAAARVLVKFGLRLSELLQGTPAQDIDFEASFAVLHQTLSAIFDEGIEAYQSRHIREELLALWPSWPRFKIRRLLAKEEGRIARTLDREYETLLSRKALFRMGRQGKIDPTSMWRELRKYE